MIESSVIKEPQEELIKRRKKHADYMREYNRRPDRIEIIRARDRARPSRVPDPIKRAARKAKFEANPGTKVCIACLLEKCGLMFRWRRNTCRKCERKKQVDVQKKNGYASVRKYQASEKGRAQMKAYRARPDIKARVLARGRTPQAKAKKAEWTASVKGKASHASKKHRRRAACKKGDVTAKQIRSLFEEAIRCTYCGTRFSDGVNKTLDHVTPLIRGGAHNLENLTICCMSCNCSKRDKLIEEWTCRFLGKA